jgi:hypothetical protein
LGFVDLSFEFGFEFVDSGLEVGDSGFGGLGGFELGGDVVELELECFDLGLEFGLVGGLGGFELGGDVGELFLDIGFGGGEFGDSGFGVGFGFGGGELEFEFFDSGLEVGLGLEGLGVGFGGGEGVVELFLESFEFGLKLGFVGSSGVGVGSVGLDGGGFACQLITSCRIRHNGLFRIS